jgi:S-adenosylmethionine synthetase
VVAAGLAGRCTLQLAYAIGVPEPLSLSVDTHDSSRVDEAKLEHVMREFFDFTPAGIIETLDPRRRDLRADIRVRALRARVAGFHLGEDGSRRRALLG